MLNYPLNFSFKVIAFNPQVKVTDAAGTVALYVKQKALALKEDIKIFADEAQSRQLYQLKANKIIDFSAQYNITTSGGAPLGAVKRQGARSIFKATYKILDASGADVGRVNSFANRPILAVRCKALPVKRRPVVHVGKQHEAGIIREFLR